MRNSTARIPFSVLRPVTRSVRSARRPAVALAVVCLACLAPAAATAQGPDTLQLNERGYFHARGLDVLAFHNWYSGMFSDSKLSGVELIHHGVRVATNGDVRLGNTPEQWDPIPEFEGRDVEDGRVVARLAYPDHDFRYRVVVEADGDAVILGVELDDPVPPALEGRAGLNLELLPTAFFGRTYLADGRPGAFPRHGTGPVRATHGALQPVALATGERIVLAPESPERRVAVGARAGTLELYDGRSQAQNGWFVVRQVLPSGRTGRVVEWRVEAHRIPGWTRPPVIAHSQAGYHPAQDKVAVLELDPAYDGPMTARLIRVSPDGTETERLRAEAAPWGSWLRYRYARFDFSAITEPGVYRIALGRHRTEPFVIADDVYDDRLWQPTLDTFLPVQMCHVLVNDRYRVWHGAGHLDDARQAPTDHVHFDLYAQGPTTDSPYEPGEHIPGLNVGGWHDAGDWDIRTQTQYATIRYLVQARETFGIDRDQTTVDRANRRVDLRRPDGEPDILQQIEHGVVALLAQYRAIGHAIPGIIVPTISQYTHLGDALTMTDNRVYDGGDPLTPASEPPGPADDRWAFTSRSSALDYGAAAALAAASRVLAGYHDALAEEARATAVRVWDEEQGGEPYTFRHGNTTGGRLEDEELAATVELLIATGGAKYADRLEALWPTLEDSFARNADLAVRAMPHMDEAYRERVAAAVAEYAGGLDAVTGENPFGVPVTRGGWGGAGAVLGFAMQNYILHRAFPELVGPEHTLRGLEYVLGAHPASDVSLVSGIGARSATNAYGFNRADYSYIPGGVVPGIVVVKPDLPELKEDWPFLWYESEYVINVGALFIYVANAADALLDGRGTLAPGPGR